MQRDETVIKTVKVLITILVFAAAIGTAYKIRNILVWLSVGAFLAVVINPLVTRLARNMPDKRRTLATGLVATAIIVALLSITAAFIPPVIRQTSTLVSNWPTITNNIENSIDNAQSGPLKLLREQKADQYIRTRRGEIQNYMSRFFIRSLTNVSALLSSVGATLTILALTVYLSVHGPRILNQSIDLLPPNISHEARMLQRNLYSAITGYVNGNLLTSVVAGVISALVCWIVGLPYPILLGVLVAITDLIPMIGATLGAAIVLLVAAFSNLGSFLIMLGFFIVYQQFENYVLVPRVMSRTVEMSPFAVFLSALCGAVIAGFFGALVAIPIGACAMIIFRRMYNVRRKDVIAQEKALKAQAS